MIELNYLISYYIYISIKFHNLVLRTFSYDRFVNKLFNVNKLGILNRITCHLSRWGNFKVSNIISKTLIWLTRCPPYTVFFNFSYVLPLLSITLGF